MSNRFRRLGALLCAWVLLLGCGHAMAEFSPRYQALEQGGSMALAVQLTLSSVNKLSSSSLAAVNDWLSRLHLQTAVERGLSGAFSRIDAQMEGEEGWSVTVNQQENHTLTVFSPSGNAYITSAGAPDALALLTAGGESTPDLLALPGVYPAFAEKLYGALGEQVKGKKQRSSTSIKNASASASYELYTLDGEALTALWPAIAEAAAPALAEVLRDQPLSRAGALALLPQLQFSGACAFKRFLDKQGNDMGMQFTGKAGVEGDMRKVTLYGGFTADKGGYISLTLPAVSGKNTYKLQFGAKLTVAKSGQRILEMEGNYNRRLNGEHTAAVLTGKIRNTIKDNNEHWTGKITLTATKQAQKSTYTFTPDLAYTDDGLQGKVEIRRKEGGTTTLKAAAQITLTAAEKDMDQSPVGAAKDLRGLENDRARAAVLDEMTGLTRALARLMARMPEKDRVLLTHELRTDSWMTAPAVEAAEEENEPAEENEDILDAAEEDTAEEEDG